MASAKGPAEISQGPALVQRRSGVNWIGVAVGVVVVLWLVGACSNAVLRNTSATSATHSTTFGGDTVGLGNTNSDCTPAQFKITQMNGTTDYGYLTVVGVVRNTCSVPMGVEMQLTQYGPGGKVLATDESWPASVSNIAPHSSYNFKLMETAAGGSTRYTVQPIRAQRW